MDERKRPIRGLWIRNGNYYARLVIEDGSSGKKSVRRVRLEKAETVAQAQAEPRRLLTKREDGNLPALRLTPKFCEFADHYLEIAKACKRASTVETESAHLNSWKAHLGATRLAHIKRPAIDGFITKRKAEGVSNRTVNLAIVVLRNVLNKAIDEGWLKTPPTENLRPLKVQRSVEAHGSLFLFYES